MARPSGHGPNFERRRQDIIDEVAVLFAAHGYKGTAVSDICRRVELGKGALYYYIGSKENLLTEIQNRVLAPLVKATCRINALDVSAMTRLRALSQYLLMAIFERPEHIRVYEHEYRHLTEPNRSRFVAHRHEFEGLVRSMLEEAMEAGDLKPADPNLAMLQFLNLHNHTFQWMRPGLPWSPSELSAVYYRTLMIGFGAKCATVSRAESEALRIWRTWQPNSTD